MRRVLSGCLLLVAAAPALGQSDGFRPIAELRGRFEHLSTPAATAAVDRDYEMTVARLRLGFDWVGRAWTIHALGQAAGAWNLPENAGFGAGRLYYLGSGSQDEVDSIDLLELSLAYRGPRFRFTLGRQGFLEGFDAPTGIDHLDNVKRARLAERLVGNFDWTNVGRRYEGVTAAWAGARGTLSGFGLRVLSGGFNHLDPLERLEDTDVYGLSYTFKRGALLPGAELRVFGVGMRDDRAPATAAAGGEIDVQGYGLSLLGGDDRNDWLVWGVVQRGDWGASEQRAWAAIAEAGHRFANAPLRTWARGGVAVASGDDAPGGGAHRSFLNMVPTNHKWYGAMDYVAFSNLRTVYSQLILTPAPGYTIELGLHRFELDDSADSWYLGSGPTDQRGLGYLQRANISGDRHLGDELDLVATFPLGRGFTGEIGGGVFRGGPVAEASLPERADGRFVYAQLLWKR